MSTSIPPRRHPPSGRMSLLSWLMLILGVGGFAAVWVILAMFNDRQNSWMAVLGALDVAWMLRLGGCRTRALRIGLGVAGTALIVALANWGIIAAQLGAAFGRTPWDSALRLGRHHAWTLAQLANGPLDLLWIAMALVLAAAICALR